MNVLVVEDNPVVQSGLVRALQHAGFNVSAVDDALAALSEVERTLFDAIVCDVQLPYVDGTEFYERLEQKHASMSHRVIFVTAMLDDPVIGSFIRQTGRPALSKPFELESLVAVVRQVAAQARMLDEPILGLRAPDRGMARRLPDEFARGDGAALDRLRAIIDRDWSSVVESERRQLAQMLIFILESVIQGGPVTDALRDECESAVVGWAARQ